jgi:hypothetical protein
MKPKLTRRRQRRPVCINHGCNKPVTFSNTDSQGNKRWRPHCGHCQKASYGGHDHAPGVTPFKTGKCSNTDGHLGWKCPINWSQAKRDGIKIPTHIDHIDGDHANNVVENAQEICSVCHDNKSMLNGDRRGHRYR